MKKAVFVVLLWASVAMAQDARLEALDNDWRRQQLDAFESGMTAGEGDMRALTGVREQQAVQSQEARKRAVSESVTKLPITEPVAETGMTEYTGEVFKLAPGTFIPALLVTGLNSELPGYLVAQVSENVYDTATGQVLLIPQGSRLFGLYSSKVIFGQKRPLVSWSTLILPDATVLNLDGMPGTDRAGYSGFKAHVNAHYSPMLTTAVVASVFSGLVDMFDDDDDDGIRIESLTLSDSIPVGGIIMYAGSSAPDGWHLCDGTTISDSSVASSLGLSSYPSLSSSTSGISYIIKTESSSSSIASQLSAAGINLASASIKDSYGNEIGEEIAEMLGDMAEELFKKHLERAPRLVVKPGYRLHAVVNKELYLPAWD